MEWSTPTVTELEWNEDWARLYLVTAALELAERWDIFPANVVEKKSCKSAQFSNGRKWGKTKDPEEIRADFRRWPAAGIGVPTGVDNKIFVVEADTPEGHDVDGIASLRALESEHGPLPETLTAESPSGSPHRYFNWPADKTIRNSTSKVAPGVDVRGEGGMVIAPPSLKAGVGHYRWLNEGTPIADAPAWLIELITRDDGNGEERAPGEPEASIEEVASALSVIPNPDLGWEKWNNIAMATWRSTAGSAAGLAEFVKWSKKSKKHNEEKTIERWAHYFTSPPNEIGFGTLAFLAGQADPGWRHAGEDEAKKPPDAELRWLDMASWDAGDPPPLEWAIPVCVPREQVGLYSGVGGTGKTTNELLKNVAHVLGLPWFGMHPTRGPAFYVGSEDPDKVLRIRLTTIARYYGTTFEELIAKGLHILNLFGEDATIFFYNNKTQRVETTPLYQQIYQAAGDLKPINIALDPLTRIFSGSEIDRTQVYRVVGYSQALAVASGGSVTLLSHPSLHGISSGSGLSGSTAWHDAFRFRQYLRKVKDEEDAGEADDETTDSGLRELMFMKNQYGPPVAKILLRYQNGLFLPEATPDEFEKSAAEAQADTVFLELLDRLNAQGRNVGASPNSSNYAPTVFAGEGTGISRKQFSAAMTRLFNGNRIRIETYGPPSRQHNRLVRRGG
jgi:RecA-family ATPase